MGPEYLTLEGVPQDYRWRPQPPRAIGLIAGSWGDCLLGLGMFKALAGRGSLIVWSEYEDITRLCSEQSFVDSVIYAKPADSAEYNRIFGGLTRKEPDAMAAVVATVEDQSNIDLGHLTFYGLSPIAVQIGHMYRWTGAKLPMSTWRRAASVAERLGPFVLFNPVSVNSAPFDDQWPLWNEALAYAAQYSPYKVLVVGKGWELGGSHPNVLNAIDSSLTMMEIFALAHMASAVVTTCSGLAHWCAIQGLPAVVCGNEALSRRGSYFRSFLTVPNIEFIDKKEGLDSFVQAYSKVV